MARTTTITITAGGPMPRCAFCRRRLVIRWTKGNSSLWACPWHTRRGWRALDSVTQPGTTAKISQKGSKS